MNPPTPSRRSHPRPLACGIAALLLATAGGPAQTYTAPTSGTFTNPYVWNFGAGPVPASDAALLLRLQSFGGSLTASNDLNLTLQSLDFSGNGTLALAGLLGGNFAFTGGAGLVNFGSSATVAISAGVVLGSGLTSLTLDGAGPGALTLSGVISSNTSAGAPLIVATDAANPAAGIVTLSGANTFSGGVVLNSGTLNLANARALGARANTLTVNGGNVRTNATLSIANDFSLNSTLNVNGSATLASPAPLSLSGVLSGAGGVRQSGAGLGAVLQLRGINTYTGATSIRGLDHAGAPLDEAASIHIAGAAGSILTTSGIDVRAGGIFRLDYADGHSAVNTRVTSGTSITTTGGFLETFGNDGLVFQNLGTVNAGGLTSISANTNGGGPDLAGAATQVTIANLQRATGGTVTFTGANLGGTAVAAGLGASQGNVLLTQLNGGAPSAALVGGGGSTGATNISILPWALGDIVNDANRYDAGSGFVTYGANGVRVLDPFTEYNTSNSFNGLGGNFQNIRIANSVTNPAAPVTVNSVFVEAAGLNIGGANTITLGSGALATLADHAISAPLLFGAGGAGEAIVSVIGPLNTTTTLTLSGQVTAGSLVKGGHGILVLTDSTNAIAGGVTINGGQLSVDAIAQLGGATSLAINSPSQSLAGAALTYTGGGADVLAVPVATNGGMAGFHITNSSLDVSGGITGVGGVRKDGAGTLLLSGANTYSGGTYLGAGSLEFDSDARLGAAGGFLHTSGGTLNLTGGWTTSRPLTFETGSTLVVSKGANNVTLSGAIDGTGPLQSIGSGTIDITSGDNGYAGAITLGSSSGQGGTLSLTGAGALNAASVVFGASGGPAGTYTLDLSAATGPGPTPWRSFSALTTTGGFGQSHFVQLGATALSPVDLRLSSGSFGGTAGSIQGFGKLIKTGPNPFTLNGTLANTFTGAVEVWGGTLSFGANAQLGNAANAITVQGGILNGTANGTTNRAITLAATPQSILRGATPVTLGNGLSAASGTALTITGAIGGPGGFAKSGLGTVQLAATNTYAGDTQITAGILGFTADAQLGSASSRIRLGNGTATLRLTAASGTVPVNRTVFVLGGVNTINIPASAPTLNLGGQLLSASGAELLLSGAGKFVISGDNRSLFTPVRISSGSTANSLTLNSTGQLRRATIRLDGVNTSFNVSTLTREVGGIQNVDTGSSIQLGAGGQLTAGFNNTNMTWAGEINGTGTASFTKTGTGTVAITAGTATANFPGGFHLLSGSGNTTTLSSLGALTAKTAITIGAWGSNTNRGPLLHLSNTASNLNTRLADSQAIFSNAGEILLSTNAGTATNEVAGSLRGAGMTTVTMTTGGTLNFSDAVNGLTRVNGGTFLFRAGNANMGSAAATTAIANLTFGNLPGAQLVGGGGAAATTTISILPFAVGDTTAAGNGSNFVTYGANGIRVLNTTTEVVNHVNVGALTGTTTNNVRLANTALTTTTLGGGVDRTINALNIAGTASRTRLDSAAGERLIVESGLVLSSVNNVHAVNAAENAGVPLGIQVAELQTGAGNTRELNVFTTGGDLAIGSPVTTSGGLTKSGAGALYLTSTASTYMGATTVNAGNLVIDSLAALGGSTSIQGGGGFLKYRGADATLTQSILAAGGSGAGLGASAGFHVGSGIILSAASASVTGDGGILKDGTGVLALTGSNTNTGATLIAAGALAIDGPAALGTNARVVFTDSAISAAGGQTLRFDAPMTLTQDFVVNSAQNGVGFGFDTNGNDVTLSGTLLDARGTGIRGLYKFGAGELNLTATEMYTGATQVFGGTLRLSGANGSLLNSTGTGGFLTTATVLVNPGAALVLDNAATNHNNRLPDVWDTPFGTGNAASGALRLNGGELEIIGHAAGTSERINQLDLFAGTVTLSGGGTTLTSGLLARTSAVSAGLIRGTNLGALPGPGSTNWFVTDLGSGGVQLGGAGGAEGTPFINLLPGFMGDTSATGSGTDFLTYAADTGFRTLTAGEYAGTIPAGNFDLNRAPNVALAGAASVNQTTALTALKLGSGASVGGTGTLLLGQSTVLATGNASIGVPSLSTSLTGANPGYVFLTPGAGVTLTVGSTLPNPGLMKYGEGTLALTGRAIGAGAVTVAAGTLRLDGATAALNPRASAITVLPGATFDLGGSDRTIASVNTAALIGTFNLGQISDGTVALGANRLTIYDDVGGVFTGDITGTGGLSTSFFSGGGTFTQPLSYTGSTILRGGTLRLAGAGTLASTAVELRSGGTLQFTNTDDNAAAGGYVANRIGTGVPITLAGGFITFTENANTPGHHHLGAATLAGRGVLSITSGATAPSTVTIANVTRTAAHGTLAVSATNLGLTQSPVGGARVFLTQIEGGAPGAALIGGGGAVGTTNQSILPWAFAPSPVSSYLTYGADGLRPLAASEYETNLLNAPTSATVNSRTTAAQTLTAPRTVNSLLVTGGGSNVSGAFDLTLTSGALAISGQTIGVNTNALLTGAGNTREMVINGAGTLNYSLTTSGGVTKFGSGNLTLGGNNTFTGGLTINEDAINFTADTQLGAAGGAIRFGGSLVSAPTLTYTGSSTTPLVFNRPVETTGFGAFSGVASHRWQLGGVISGAGGIRYSGANAVFEINAANTYTGATDWTGGHLYISGDSAFGNGGELVLRPSAANQNIVLRTPWTTSRLIDVRSASAIQTNGYDATWNGQIIGTAPLTKNGTGSLLLTEAMPYSGVLTVAAGAVVLKDRGSLAANASTHTIRAGAGLTLDDTATHSSDRLHDSSGTITLNGGALTVLGSSSATTEEVFNVLALGAGASAVTLTPGSGQSAIVRLAGLPTNAATAASLWRGTNLGVNAPGTANSANLLLTPNNTNAFPLTGGGAPAGHPSISIIRGGFGDTSATGSGTQLVTYDEVRGVRLLDPDTEYTTTLVNGSSVTDNVKADGAALALANNTTINALWLKDGGSVTGAGELGLTAGNLLVTGAGNTVAKPLITGSNALAIGGPGDVTFTSALTSANSGGLIKTGAGTLTLSVANTYTGDTVLKDGIFAVGNASAFASTAVQVQGGEMRNVSGGPLTLANDLTLNGTWKIGGAQAFAFAGSVTLNHATREIETTNTATTTISGAVQNSQSLINYGLTKTGAGRLVLSNSNSFDGPTTVNNGTLEAAAAGALGSTNSVALNSGGTLLLSSAGDRINDAATFHLNGGKFDAGGTSEGTATTIGLGALTLSASSIIDFTGAAATLTFASGTYVSGVLSINNWSGLASTAGIDGVNDRLIFAGDNTARLAFLSAFNQSSILFGGFGSGYTALQFDTNYFEVVPVPEPSGLAVAASLLGLIGWRERRRAQQHRRSARHQSL